MPAAFGTWLLLLRDYGTLRPRDVLEYAIGYAEHGYPVAPAVSATMPRWPIPSAAHWPGSAEVYLAGGVPAPGVQVRQPRAGDGVQAHPGRG